MILYSASGDAPRTGKFSFLFPKTKKFIETGVVPDKLPRWLTEADLNFFRRVRARGLSRCVNWCRNSIATGS